MNIDWIEVYNRVVFKGRDVAGAGSVGDAMASGRFSIYHFYFHTSMRISELKNGLLASVPFGYRMVAHVCLRIMTCLTFSFHLGFLGWRVLWHATFIFIVIYPRPGD